MGGTEEPCYEINPVMFCADDENCGHVHTDIVDVRCMKRCHAMEKESTSTYYVVP